MTDFACGHPNTPSIVSKNSPYEKTEKGDIVRETAEACREFGLKFGVYLSTLGQKQQQLWQRGKEYDDYYLNQLTELLTEYGDIFVIWLDGACGEGPNGKVQKYDWQRYYKVMRELQPNAVISSFRPGHQMVWKRGRGSKTE